MDKIREAYEDYIIMDDGIHMISSQARMEGFYAGCRYRDEEVEKIRELLNKLYENKYEPDKLYIYWQNVKESIGGMNA